MAIITKERLKDIQNYLGDQFKDHDFKFDQIDNLTDQINQTYLGLRYAVAQVNKLDISTDWEHDESARKAVVNNVHINVFNDSKTVALAKAGMELHGIMTDFPDEAYGQKMIDYVNNFACAYSVDNSFGLYANQRTLLTMFMDIPCTLAPNGNKYVQQAQKSINYQAIGLEINNGINKYDPLYPNDGLYHDTVQSKRVYKALIEILQNSLDLPVTGVYDKQTRDKTNQLNWDVVDKMTALALSLEGYWIGDINNVTYEDEANLTGTIQFCRIHDIDNKTDFYRKVFEYLPMENDRRFSYAISGEFYDASDRGKRELGADGYNMIRGYQAIFKGRTDLNGGMFADDKWFILQKNGANKRTLISQPDIDFGHTDPFFSLGDHRTFKLSMTYQHDNDISLGVPYYAHTQTIYQVDNSHLLVGVNHKDNIKDDEIAWALDVAYVDINKHQYGEQILTDKNNAKIYLNDAPKIIGLDSIMPKPANPKNSKDPKALKRTEIAITPNRKYLLVCDVSNDNTGYFGLYDLNIILNQLKQGNVNLLDYKPVKPIMIVPNITDYLSKSAFIQTIDNYQQGQKVTDQNYSIQGYAIDNDLNIYIDSQPGPIQKKKDVTPYLEYPHPCIYKLKYGVTSLDQSERISLNELKPNLDYDILHSQLISITNKNNTKDTIIIDNTASELEGIQILDTNRLYISVTYHEFDTKTKSTFDRDQLIQIAW